MKPHHWLFLFAAAWGCLAYYLTTTPPDPLRGGTKWIGQCATHRPLADCQRDWKAMNGP